MIVSMTGFGDATADRNGAHYAVENPFIEQSIFLNRSSSFPKISPGWNRNWNRCSAKSWGADRSPSS